MCRRLPSSSSSAAAAPTAASSTAPSLVPFTQFEFPGLIGLPDGRYLAREGESDRVLIVKSLDAPRPAGRSRRRPRPVDPELPETVPLTRVTVAGSERFEERTSALRWLEATAGDAERRSAQVRAATRLLNRALNALRAAARDPLVQDTGATRALAIRIGFGSGEELAEGRWTEARALPPPRRGRLDDVDPQTRVAAVLAGREEVHPAETLLQRARLDLDQGRIAEADYGARAAAAALEEIPGEPNEKIRKQLAALRERLNRKIEP